MFSAFRYPAGLAVGLAAVLMLSGPVSAQPQTALDAWKQQVGAADGILRLTGQAHGGYHRAYVCRDFGTASAVVRAIPRAGASGNSATVQSLALQRALRQRNCRPAVGRFRVVALGPETEIDHGVEAAEFWTALDARARTGPVGLVFDSSPYAIRERSH